MPDTPNTNSWDQSSNIWNLVMPPLCPVEEDARIMLDLAAPALAGRSQARVLVLGVTPQIITMPWPDGVSLTAVDADAAMIDRVWQPSRTHPSRVMQADWSRLPFDDGAFDLCVGDGSLNALPDVSLYPAVVSEIVRVLTPHGRLVLRFFMRAIPRESPDSVLADALAGRFSTIFEFRFRLALASARPNGMVWLPDALEHFNRLVPDRAAFERQTGWERALIDRGDIVLAQKLSLNYPDLDCIEGWMGPQLEQLEVRFGNYPSGRVCPSIAFRPKLSE